MIHNPAVEQDLVLADFFKPCNYAQGRACFAYRGPQYRNKLSVFAAEVCVINRFSSPFINLPHMISVGCTLIKGQADGEFDIQVIPEAWSYGLREIVIMNILEVSFSLYHNRK